MKIGEKAILRCRSDYAYGSQGQGKIPANATLNFDVELLNFGPKKKEVWEYTENEKIEESNKLKEFGTIKFQEKKYDEALKDYELAAELSENIPEMEALWISCKLNISLCYINLQNYSSASTAGYYYYYYYYYNYHYYYHYYCYYLSL